MITAWRGFWRLDRRARSLAIEAALALAATWVGLRVVGFRRWNALLMRFAPLRARRPGSHGVAPLETAQEIARIQEQAARHLIFGASCLEQSLVLRWLLARRGIPAQLRLGARKQAGRFEAHAWVQLGSVILNDSADGHRHFTPFDGSIVSMETQPH